MALIDHLLSRAIKRGQLTFIDYRGNRRIFGSPDPSPDFPSVTVRMTDSKVGRDIVMHPALGAGEAYMDGRLVVEEGDVYDLVRLFKTNSPYGGGNNLDPVLPLRALGSVKHRLDRINMARRSKKNVAHHYDLSDRLYDLFLDADRQYSCAYFTDPAYESLDQAQLDKKAHIVAKLAIEPGMRVLDIGCGWGGMALYIHAKTGAEVLGVTLSEEQIKVARRRAEEAGVADKVKFELIDYRSVTGQFDRIVSVGMFEHVGPPQYRTFFRKCRELMTPEGVMLLHTIGRQGPPSVTDDWTTKYIFPGGYNPALSEIVRGYEGLKMFCTDVEVLRLHYAYTLEHWYKRTVAVKDEIVALYDERFYRMWQFYLAGADAAFRYGGLVNYQIQIARNRNTLPITRDYMLEAERALAAPDAPAVRARETA
ncbi:class I SAM-dependent methyltransferase [Sphingomonas koreensis]|nr:class I SAM-dependent methyltransferase [Sphingomonas koreensis]